MLLLLLLGQVSTQYTPDWESLDSRPLPDWYDEAKVGIFMHWGPYSVPGVASEWFWYQWNRRDPDNEGDMEIVKYMEDHYPPNFKYQEFGPDFSAEFFNATYWAELVGASGAKYFVFTSKHHDGFTNWPSDRNFGWNSADIGPKRDVIGELAEAFRTENKTRFGLYHSLFEWYNPLYLADKVTNHTVRNFVEQKVMPELKDLVTKYQPDVIWSDGDWEAGPDYWDTLNFLAWLYNKSPVKDRVVTNDRWGTGVLCKHGDFFTCSDRYNPGVLQPHKWENAMTVDKQSWGFRRNMKLNDVMTMKELIETLTVTVSCGGNLLVNVGPNRDGVICPIFEERLRDLGSWLDVNGEAVYGSLPWTYQNDSLAGNVWYTSKRGEGQAVYGFVLGWPETGQISVASPKPGPDTIVTMLGYQGKITWLPGVNDASMTIIFPDRAKVSSDWAFVIKMVNLDNGGNHVWR